MWYALFLTFLAGAATTLGGVIATHKIMLRRGALATALAFSAGAMLYVSFTDILGKSRAAFAVGHSEQTAYLLMAAAFVVGLTIMVILNRFIPHDINPNEQEGPHPKKYSRKLLRSGLFIAIALSLHNFPEGFLVFMSALDDPTIGIAIAVAIAIHNIPEGIAVAAPLYAATKKRAKTIWLTALTGMAEPAGALIGFLLLAPFLNDILFGWVFGVVAGIMIFISIDELLPAAKRYETNQYQTTYGFIAGMLVIAASIALFL